MPGFSLGKSFLCTTVRPTIGTTNENLGQSRSDSCAMKLTDDDVTLLLLRREITVQTLRSLARVRHTRMARIN